MRTFHVEYVIGYQRTADPRRRKQEPDPTPTQLEAYVAASHPIAHPISWDKDAVQFGKTTYKGHCTFALDCLARSEYDVWAAFMDRFMEDFEWEAPPGHGNFVFPNPRRRPPYRHGADEVGILTFRLVRIDGKTYDEKHRPEKAPRRRVTPTSKRSLARQQARNATVMHRLGMGAHNAPLS